MPAFIAQERNQPTLLQRRRPHNHPAYVCYHSDTDGFAAYFTHDVLAYLHEQLDQATPNETMGLLAGRVCADEEGPYVVVCAAENAQVGEVTASPGFVRFSGCNQVKLRDRLEYEHHVLEPMGWYHTHPAALALFSKEDFLEQATWPEGHQVGVVIGQTVQGAEISVYRGSHGQLLQPARQVWSWAGEEAMPPPTVPPMDPSVALEAFPHLTVYAVIHGLEDERRRHSAVPVETFMLAFLFMLLPGVLVGMLVWWLMNTIHS